MQYGQFCLLIFYYSWVFISIPKRKTGTIFAPRDLSALRSRNVRSVCGDQLRVGDFRRNFDALPTVLFLRFGVEGQQILMSEAILHVFEVRVKPYRTASKADVIRFASGFVSKAREIYLPPIVLPVAVADVARARSINAIGDDAGAHSVVDGSIEIGILQVSDAVIEINSVGGHEHFPAGGALRPAFDQIAERKIWTGICAANSQRKAQSFRG